MSWFGWLTKGRLETRLLDAIVFFVELFAAFGVYLLYCAAHDWVRKLKTKTKTDTAL